VWNYRREALTPLFEAGGEAAQKASDEELALTQVGAVLCAVLFCVLCCAVM